MIGFETLLGFLGPKILSWLHGKFKDIGKTYFTEKITYGMENIIHNYVRKYLTEQVTRMITLYIVDIIKNNYEKINKIRTGNPILEFIKNKIGY